MKIDPARLSRLRNERALTRPELARRSEISERTIQRLENEPQQCRKTREDTVSRLARALGVKADVLTGKLPLPEPDGVPFPASERVQIGAQVSPKARLAYDLVKRRYGVNATEIINMAPLFFALLAEGSLARRRKEVEEGYGRLEQVSSGHGVFVDALEVAGMSMAKEEESIGKNDLFGEHLVGNVGTPYFDPSRDNPFVSHLRSLNDELAIPGVVDVDDGDLAFGSPSRLPDYDICRDELDGMANGSAKAKWALEIGYVRLSEIPEELLGENVGEERAKWLEGRLPEVIKRFLEVGDTVPQVVATDPGGKLREVLEEAATNENEAGTSTGRESDQ